MAEHSSSGFKTFLFLLISLILAFFLGCGAILMISPDIEIFGVSYASNNKTITYTEVPNYVGTLSNLQFNNLEKVVVQATNADVKVLCGTEGASASQIALVENSMGYVRSGSEKEYTLTCYKNGLTLYITLTEPDYSFITLFDNTTLNLKINSNFDLISNVKFDITTTNGNVFFGGTTAPTYQADAFKTPELKVETINGNIIFDQSVSLESALYPQTTLLDLKTTNGAITLNNDIDAKTANLSSQSNKITTKDFTFSNMNLTIKSYNSNINIGNVAGNVLLDTAGGIFQAKIISGSFSTGEDLNITNILVNEVGGGVAIVKENGNFNVNIAKTLGDVFIVGGTKNIVLGDIRGNVTVEMTSGNINATINASCTGNMQFATTTGSVVAKFGKVSGENTITTTRGKIDIKYVFGVSFYLNAETGGILSNVWENSTSENPIENKAIGENPLAGNKLNLYSTYGNIVFNGISA